MTKLLRILGTTLLALGSFGLVIGYGAIWVFQGTGALGHAMSPTRVSIWLTVLLALLPGLLLHLWAYRRG